MELLGGGQGAQLLRLVQIWPEAIWNRDVYKRQALYIARAIMDYVELGSPYIQKHCLVDWYSSGADSLGPTQQAVIQALSLIHI